MEAKTNTCKIKFFLIYAAPAGMLLILNILYSLVANIPLQTPDWIALILSIGLSLAGIISFASCRYEWNGTLDLPVQVTEVKNRTKESFSLVWLYLMPFFAHSIFSYLILGVTIILMLIIWMETDFMIDNLALTILGYKMYDIEYSINGKNPACPLAPPRSTVSL